MAKNGAHFHSILHYPDNRWPRIDSRLQLHYYYIPYGMLCSEYVFRLAQPYFCLLFFITKMMAHVCLWVCFYFCYTAVLRLPIFQDTVFHFQYICQILWFFLWIEYNIMLPYSDILAIKKTLATSTMWLSNIFCTRTIELSLILFSLLPLYFMYHNLLDTGSNNSWMAKLIIVLHKAKHIALVDKGSNGYSVFCIFFFPFSKNILMNCWLQFA